MRPWPTRRVSLSWARPIPIPASRPPQSAGASQPTSALAAAVDDKPLLQAGERLAGRLVNAETRLGWAAVIVIGRS